VPGGFIKWSLFRLDYV